jgi:hypothetical protein
MGVPVRIVENASQRFNREDYYKLREYVDYALSLPVVLPAVEVFAGYKTSGVAGLEPPNLRSLFEQVRENAGEWDPAENAISAQAAALGSVSSRIVRYGEALLDAIRSMPFYARIRATVGQDPAGLPVIQIPDETFNPVDAEKKTQLAGQLEVLKRVNQEQVGDTGEAMRKIASFRGGIEKLEPIVTAKRLILQKSGLERIGNETTVEPMIASLQQEYDRTVQTGMPDAAAAQAKRNALEAAIQKLKSQIDVYRDRQRLTYTLGRLFTHFSELRLVMVDAEMSVGHLWLAWREAAAALENSSAGFGNITGARKLVTFASDFQTIVGDWKIVRNRAIELGAVF